MALGATASAGLLVGADMMRWEPHRLVVERVELPIRGLPEAFDGFTIAHLSDFHHEPYTTKQDIDTAVALTNSLKPDLIASTGDYVSSRETGKEDPEAAQTVYPCAESLANLRSRFGTFGVIGNHDYNTQPELIVEALRAKQIHMMRNQSFPIEKDGARIWVCGVDSYARHDYDNTLRKIPIGEKKILLAHEPDLAEEAAQFSFDVQLSGHSHGGQVKLPLLGALYLPEFGKRYFEGLYRIPRPKGPLATGLPLQLYVNRGIGMVHLPIRFDCPPEITLHTLRVSRTNS